MVLELVGNDQGGLRRGFGALDGFGAYVGNDHGGLLTFQRFNPGGRETKITNSAGWSWETFGLSSLSASHKGLWISHSKVDQFAGGFR